MSIKDLLEKDELTPMEQMDLADLMLAWDIFMLEGRVAYELLEGK